MPRPRKKLNADEKAQVEALAAFLSQEQIADYFGVGKTTWFEILKRQPDVSERYKKGKAKAIGSIAQGLVNQARNGNLTAAIFYLKTQARWKDHSRVVMGTEGPEGEFEPFPEHIELFPGPLNDGDAGPGD